MDKFYVKTLATGQLGGAKPSLLLPAQTPVPEAGAMGPKKVKKSLVPATGSLSPLGTLKAKCKEQLLFGLGAKPKLAVPFAPPADPLDKLSAASGIAIGRHRLVVWEDIPL